MPWYCSSGKIRQVHFVSFFFLSQIDIYIEIFIPFKIISMLQNQSQQHILLSHGDLISYLFPTSPKYQFSTFVRSNLILFFSFIFSHPLYFCYFIFLTTISHSPNYQLFLLLSALSTMLTTEVPILSFNTRSSSTRLWMTSFNPFLWSHFVFRVPSIEKQVLKVIQDLEHLLTLIFQWKTSFLRLLYLISTNALKEDTFLVTRTEMWNTHLSWKCLFNILHLFFLFSSLFPYKNL